MLCQQVTVLKKNIYTPLYISTERRRCGACIPSVAVDATKYVIPVAKRTSDEERRGRKEELAKYVDRGRRAGADIRQLWIDPTNRIEAHRLARNISVHRGAFVFNSSGQEPSYSWS